MGCVATPIISHIRYTCNTICGKEDKKIKASYEKYEKLKNTQTDYMVAKELKISPNILYDWRRGRSHPRIGVLSGIAQLFDVKIEDLLEDTE